MYAIIVNSNYKAKQDTSRAISVHGDSTCLAFSSGAIMETKEIWVDVKGFEGGYQISNKGRLKSFKSNRCGRVLKNTNKTGWYFSVVLRYNGNVKSTRIHRLVAEAFIDNPNNKREVNHKDCNKQNNCVSNLEWVTRGENVNHAIKHNPNIIAGMNHYNKFVRPEKILQFTIKGVFLAEFDNATEASKATGVCIRNISQVSSKEEYKPGLTRKQAGGFIWKHESESLI